MPPRFRLLPMLFAMLALLGGASAHAAAELCNEGPAIVRAAYPEAPEPDENFRVALPSGDFIWARQRDEFDQFALICKVWPAHPELLLAAVPRMRPVIRVEDGHDGDLDVLVLERATMKVLQRHTVAGLMFDDAVRINKLSLDTARYDVTAEQRAFGVRLSRDTSSRAILYGQTSLRLFVPDGDRLDMVLDGVLVEGTTGEWDTNCAGYMNETKTSLAMALSVREGYRDITASVRETRTRSEVQEEGCVELPDGNKNRRITLRFDGTRYVIPESLRSMDNEALAKKP